MSKALAWVVGLGFVAGLAMAGEPGAGGPKLGDGKGQVTLTWDEFVKITGYDPAKKGGQVLTIPWDEVEKLLDVKIDKVGKTATVDLPWNDFKALLEWSIQKKAATPVELPPPTEYIIGSSDYTGNLTDDGAEFTLKLKVDILKKKGWKKIPVLPASVALMKATLPEGAYLNTAGESVELLTEKSGAIDVTLQFAVVVAKEAGTNRVTFPRVVVGSSVLDLTLARENVDVKVAGAQSQLTKTDKGTTKVAAAIPSGLPITISWERALPKITPPPTKIYAETQTLVGVAEGVLLCQETINFNILHTPVRELKLAVPKEVSILTVTGESVVDWRVDDKGELAVTFRAEMIGAQPLRVAYERPAKDTVEAPIIRAVGVEREKGYVGVVAVSNVEIEGDKVTGATSIDPRQLPAELVAMTKQPVLLAYRYVTDKFTIPLTIKKHGEVSVLITIVDSALFTAMQLEDGRRMTKAVYTVRNNRNQFLRLQMPKGAELWSVEVGGSPVAPAKDDKDNILIPLIRSASSAAELASFPVDLVYVETPATAAPSRGTLRVDLPKCDAPIMHVMTSFYLPSEGAYKSWLFGESGFTGPLRIVKDFASMATGPTREVVVVDAAKQAVQLEQQAQTRADTQARAAGATPIRVRLPINGRLFRLEKILALPKDELWFEVRYRGWETPK